MCTYAPVEILATHIHIYIYTHTHTHIHIHIHVYSLVHIHMHTYIHTYTYIYIHAYIHTYTHTHIHTHTHIYAYARIAEEYVHLYSHTTSIYPPSPLPPHPHTCSPPLSRSLTVRNTSTQFSCIKSWEEGWGRGGGGGGEGGGHSCIFLFLVWFFLCPISPKADTTLQVKPIVQPREYVYFLYKCIHTLASRSQLPPFLS